MQYCSNCDVPLYPASLEAGHCLSCGAPILPAGERTAPSQELLVLNVDPVPVPIAYPAVQVAPTPQSPSHKRLVLASLGGAALLLVILILVLLKSSSGQLSGTSTVGTLPSDQSSRPSSSGTQPSSPPLHTPNPGGSPDSTASASTTPTAPSSAGSTPTTSTTPAALGTPPSGATSTTPTAPGTPPSSATPTTSTTPTAQGTPPSTATPGTTPTATPSPAPTATAAMMSITPSSFSSLLCLNASAQFTLTNTGGRLLQWTAHSTNANFTISPNHDGLDAGQQETINVTNISGSGTITIQDPQAANSPLQVTISCTL